MTLSMMPIELLSLNVCVKFIKELSESEILTLTRVKLISSVSVKERERNTEKVYIALHIHLLFKFLHIFCDPCNYLQIPMIFWL